jgi:two-component system response regulator HydG
VTSFRVLVVDDKPTMVALIVRLLGEMYTTVAAADGDDAIEQLSKQQFDLVLSDIRMPGADGMKVLAEIKRQAPETVVILMTAFVTIKDAVESIKMGAYDYIPKPFEPDELRIKVARALEYKRLRDETKDLNAALSKRYSFDRLVGTSETMAQTFARLAKASRVDLPVFLQGEVGTGKQLAARAVHYAGPRRLTRFIAIDCRSDRDADALQQVLADPPIATVFFAEVGELSPTGQGRVYRALQETRQGTVRFMSASRQDLYDQVEGNLFRKDLYYGLRVIAVQMPPLRQRREDVGPLSLRFLNEMNHPRELSAEALKTLTAYDWPGNVAELKSVIAGAAAVSTDQITPSDLPPEVRQPAKVMALPAQSLAVLTYREAVDLLKERATREYLEALMLHTQGNVSRAAAQAGLARETLHRLLKKFEVAPESFRR